MKLDEYYSLKKGVGVLSTADSDGKVCAAIYATPHFIEDGTLAFIMRDRLSHHNLQSNPHAAYLFKEEGSGYRGKRLFMTRVREEQNTELLESLRHYSIPAIECGLWAAVWKKSAAVPWAGSNRVELVQGDALDFWRVLEVDPPQRLLLVAEMKTPGEALLEFQITSLTDGQVELQMLSRFLPRGLFGILYWYVLYPFHQWIF